MSNPSLGFKKKARQQTVKKIFANIYVVCKALPQSSVRSLPPKACRICQTRFGTVAWKFFFQRLWRSSNFCRLQWNFCTIAFFCGRSIGTLPRTSLQLMTLWASSFTIFKLVAFAKTWWNRTPTFKSACFHNPGPRWPLHLPCAIHQEASALPKAAPEENKEKFALQWASNSWSGAPQNRTTPPNSSFVEVNISRYRGHM